MKSLIAGLLAAAICTSQARADSRQQQTDNLIQNLTNYAQSPSSVSGAQTMVSQSDNFSNGALVTLGPVINPGGSGGGLLGQQASGQLAGAADPSAVPPQTLNLINGIQSQIQGSQPATTAAQTTTQGNNQSRPVQTQLSGVNYQSNGIFFAGSSSTPRQGRTQQRALTGSTGGQYQAGP